VFVCLSATIYPQIFFLLTILFFSEKMLKLISSFQKLVGVQKRINKPSLNNSPTKEDLNVQRLYILSLALTAIAFCILSLIIPILISELDELNEIANNERKVFNVREKIFFLFYLV